MCKSQKLLSLFHFSRMYLDCTCIVGCRRYIIVVKLLWFMYLRGKGLFYSKCHLVFFVSVHFIHKFSLFFILFLRWILFEESCKKTQVRNTLRVETSQSDSPHLCGFVRNKDKYFWSGVIASCLGWKPLIWFHAVGIELWC